MTKFANRLKGMEKSAAIIRNIFNGMNDPEIISFGGGAPAKEVLPVDILREITEDVMRKESRGIEALQYGGVMGIKDLREFIARELLAPKGIEAKVENIMIVNGGLEGLYLLLFLH
jgi:2-aminoadipate transaminase